MLYNNKLTDELLTDIQGSHINRLYDETSSVKSIDSNIYNWLFQLLENATAIYLKHNIWSTVKTITVSLIGEQWVAFGSSIVRSDRLPVIFLLSLSIAQEICHVWVESQSARLSLSSVLKVTVSSKL